jgi:manganese transport protein
MEGYLSLRINPMLRRLITRLIAIIPALIVIAVYGESNVDALLVLSQVILSLQLGFAIIPLIHFVSDKKTMGSFAIKPIVQIAAWLIATVLIYLNLQMLINEATGVFAGDNTFAKIILVLLGILFAALLVYIILHPLLSKNKKSVSIQMHPGVSTIKTLSIPAFNKIAVALDYSANDEKLLAYAIGQGKEKTNYLLLHIVESASANLHGKDSDDFETIKDTEQMEFYVQQLKERGFETEGKLGFRNRVKEIARIVNENNADMLVIGAHGHTALKDFIYGETVNAVRHELKIPVLVVNL